MARGSNEHRSPILDLYHEIRLRDAEITSLKEKLDISVNMVAEAVLEEAEWWAAWWLEKFPLMDKDIEKRIAQHRRKVGR